MPWTYTIDADRNVIFTKGTGILTEADFTAGLKQSHQDPGFHPGLSGFFDYTGVTDWKVSSSFLGELAKKRKFSDKTKSAILVQNALSYGLSRMYQTFVKNGQVQIFTDRAEALAWLNEGVPPEKHIT